MAMKRTGFLKTGEAYKSIQAFSGKSMQLDRKSGFIKMSKTHLAGWGEVDLSYLEAAADIYKISPDPTNYNFSANRIVVADIPNRNMDCFKHEDLLGFNAEHGKMTFQTFVGKPLYFEHNQVLTDARGIIVASRMRKDHDYWVVENIVGADRTKDATLAKQILNGKRPWFSMGCLAKAVSCSACVAEGRGKKFYTEKDMCSHLKAGQKGQIVKNDILVYENVHDNVFIEESSVADPAALIAGRSDLDLNQGYAS